MLHGPSTVEWVVTVCSLVATAANASLLAKRVRVYAGLRTLTINVPEGVHRLARIDLRRAVAALAMAVIFLLLSGGYLLFVPPPPVPRVVTPERALAGLGVVAVLVILTVTGVLDLYEEGRAEQVYRRAKRGEERRQSMQQE